MKVCSGLQLITANEQVGTSNMSFKNNFKQ